MSIQDRVVMITGVTGGLGQVAASAFVQRGARLVLVGRGKEKLAALAATLDPAQERVLTHVARLTEPEAATTVAEAAIRKFGRIDVLLHLVGGWIGGKSIGELDPREIDTMLQQHLWTTVHLARAVVPHMRRGGWGRVISVSSPTASNPGAERAPYAVGKAAQEALVLTLAQELKGSGVTANLVLVKTIDVAGERRTNPNAENESWTTPEEITATLLHLCSDEAERINGARIPLYGG
jgi:NAD(P)-dependent dehydrogenase (short-subunit alcohol dehydrogenase family)